MSTAVQCTNCPSISSYHTSGVGPESLDLEKYYVNEISKFRRSATLGRIDETIYSLVDVFLECSEEGWDGYDALPITEDAYFEAKKLIECLPLTSSIPMPEIVPEPSGEIGLEWSRGKRQVFVVSVSGSNEIIYAGLFGTNKTHGVEYFGDSLPSMIIENLIRLYC